MCNNFIYLNEETSLIGKITGFDTKIPRRCLGEKFCKYEEF